MSCSEKNSPGGGVNDREAETLQATIPAHPNWCMAMFVPAYKPDENDRSEIRFRRAAGRALGRFAGEAAGGGRKSCIMWMQLLVDGRLVEAAGRTVIGTSSRSKCFR
jgi:hypothetical protein